MPIFTVEFKAMGSHMQAWLEAPTAYNAVILQQVPTWFEAWEATLSRFRSSSELCQLNANAGQWVSISRLMLGIIQTAFEASQQTNGLFNPLILPALEAAGYQRSFNAEDFDPQPRPYQPDAQGWGTVEIDPIRSCIRLPAGSRLDLGGIAKGWAAQRAAQWLADSGSCLVDAGGDMVAYGAPTESEGWLVTLPDDTNLVLRDAAIATSGTDYRQWVDGERIYHHLIDPRTGQPAESNVLTATVIAEQATTAEVWAKAALIDGKFPALPTLFVQQDGSITCNYAFMSLRKESLCSI